MDIPSDYMRNIFKFSRNVEWSLNDPRLEVGGLLESNIVYTPESYIPRLVNLGLNMNLLGSFINIGEVGIRVEDLAPELEQYINAYSYLIEQPISTTIEELKLSMAQIGKKIVQHIQQLLTKHNINADSAMKAFEKVTKNSKNINVEMVLKALKEVLKDADNID